MAEQILHSLCWQGGWWKKKEDKVRKVFHLLPMPKHQPWADITHLALYWYHSSYSYSNQKKLLNQAEIYKYSEMYESHCIW